MAKYEFSYPQNTNYSCMNCGRCCTFWAIPVSESKVRNLESFNWGEKYPHLKNATLFEKNRRRKSGEDEYTIRMTKEGRCSFLGEDNLCLIQKEIGYDAKPDGCKIFPMNHVRLQERVFVRMNYYCPAVSSNSQKPLEQQEKMLTSTYKLHSVQAAGYEQNRDLKLWGEVRLTAADLSRVEDAMIKLVGERPPQIGLSAGLKMLENLATYLQDNPREKSVKYFQGMSLDALIDETKQIKGNARKERLIMSIFLAQDARKNTVSKMMHLIGASAFMLGFARYSSRLAGAKASRGRMEKVKLDFGADAAGEFIRRYLISKIYGKRYLQTSMNLIGGYSLILLAFKLTEHFARLIAASEGAESASVETLRRAAALADLIAIEHPAYFVSTATTEMISLLLASKGAGWDLLAA